jgi:ribose transport system ATP-binding protein
VSKTFQGLRALEGVSLEVCSGEVVAVVGQNGSGKSTLVKVLAGIHEPDPGATIDGRERLHVIHQDLGLVGSLSAIENLDLGRRLGNRACLPAPVRRERARARELVAGFGADFDVDVPVDRLSAAERAIVAIARALDGWDDPRQVLVLDEPTAALHGKETSKLFDAIRAVAARGAGVVFISHRLDEVLDLADRVVALRDGRVVAQAQRGGFDHDALVRMIAGREVAALEPRRAGDVGAVVLSVSAVESDGVGPLDLTVRAGEVVGLTGLLGSGREHAGAVIFGAAPRTAGTVEICGADVSGNDPRAAIAAGAAFLPADRHRLGAIMEMNGRENLTLPRLSTLRRLLGRLDARAEREEARQWVADVGVLPPEPERRLALFSGGNQQKVVLAKWLRNDPSLLIVDEPTQGVDVGAKVAIYDLIDRASRAGAGVVVSSSDTKELAALCDRVLVLRDGVIAAEVPREELGEARLIRESLGLHGHEMAELLGQEVGHG